MTFKLRCKDGMCKSAKGDKRPQVGNNIWEDAVVQSSWHNQAAERRHTAGAQ